MHQEWTALENIVGKGEIAHNEQFLLFPQCFLLYQISGSPLVHIFDVKYLFAVELEESKIGISGKGLKTAALYNDTPNLDSLPHKQENKLYTLADDKFILYHTIPTLRR